MDFIEAGRLVEESIKALSLPEKPAALYDPIRYTLGMGGKRVRPCLVLVANGLYSEDHSDALFPALSMEVFHNFTLLHDDIMDNATMRRKQPTVHTKWNGNVAILSGDVMSILSYQLLTKTRKSVIPEIVDLFNRTAIEVCEGQQYDMDFEYQKTVTVKDYIRMIELKTAVLIAACLKMGAILGGADQNDAKNLYEFGRNIGIAFQLMDDYLDTFGQEDKFGKKIGGDILSNKKTFLLIKALERASAREKKELERWIQSTEYIPEEKISAVKELFSHLGVDDLINAEMDKYYSLSIEFIDKLKLRYSSPDILLDFANGLMNRES